MKMYIYLHNALMLFQLSSCLKIIFAMSLRLESVRNDVRSGFKSMPTAACTCQNKTDSITKLSVHPWKHMAYFQTRIEIIESFINIPGAYWNPVMNLHIS